VGISFGGDVPTTITGKIVEVINDCIKLTVYPSKEIIYIDFEYKGIPKHIPITAIELIDQPDIIVDEENEYITPWMSAPTPTTNPATNPTLIPRPTPRVVVRC
jgi:hypothetical protein